MVKNGIRASTTPSFEEATDWMGSIAFTAVFSFLLLMAIMAVAILLPKFFEIMIPVINVNIGQYVIILFWFACMYLFTWHRDHERAKYAEFKAAIDRQDDEEYQEFVRLAQARTEMP